MSSAVDDLVGICRFFACFEREQVCCGTVTVQQCVTMQALQEGPSEVAPLAARVGNSSSAMTRLVDGLHKRGWVERDRDSLDRRRVHVSLTDAGRAQAQQLRARTQLAVDGVLAEIPLNKHAQIVESIGLLRDAMEAAQDRLSDCCRPIGAPR